MAKFRYQDKTETNEVGQTLGFAVWMGGPDLTYVGGAICEDGTTANWFKSDEADTWFSIPGYVHRKGRKVKGFLTKKGEAFHFVSYKYD